MEGLQLLDAFQTSQVGIDVTSDQIIQAVRNGEVNPLKVRVWVKTMETILERVDNETRENQMTEAGKYSEKVFEFSGAKITKAETGTKYDYAACGDTVWERLHADAETAKSRLSDREAFLKALKEPLVAVDTFTGEMVTIKPPTKTSVSGLTVSIR